MIRRTTTRRPIVPIAVLLAVGCATSTPGGEETPMPASPDASESVMIQDLRLAARVEAPPARAGTPITFGITVENEGARAVTLDFPDGQRFDFEVFEGDRSVWRWSADMAFIQMIGQETVQPGSPLEWTAVLPDGLPAGRYRLVATLTSTEPATVELSFDVNG